MTLLASGSDTNDRGHTTKTLGITTARTPRALLRRGLAHLEQDPRECRRLPPEHQFPVEETRERLRHESEPSRLFAQRPE